MPKAPESVEAFLAKLDHPRKAEIEAVRAIVLGAVPGLTEQVKWNAPSFGPAGEDRVTMRLQPPTKFQLIFHRGAKPRDPAGFTFPDPAGLLAWAAPDRGVLDLGDLATIEARRAAIADLVARWIDATR
jgi:hypothetical protein